MCGVKVGLFLPIKTRAMPVANLPTYWSFASNKCHCLGISFEEFVFCLFAFLEFIKLGDKFGLFDQINDDHLGFVVLPPADLYQAGITAIPLFVARGNFVQQFAHRRFRKKTQKKSFA